MSLPTREEANQLLKEYVQDEYQLHHAKMVAAVMEKYAKKYDEDTDLWYITGLLHDVDYYKYPEVHPAESLKWFKEWGYPEALIEAVEEHYVHHDNLKDSLPTLAAHLIAVDELSGLMYAYSLMRPTKWDGMKASKVNKKMKDHAFAAKINRDDINYGIEKAGVDRTEHIQLMIEVFKDLN